MRKPSPDGADARFGMPSVTAGTGFLFGVRPAVLRPSLTMTVDLPVGPLRPPAAYAMGRRKPKSRKPQQLRLFNPSITAAPPGLCPSCALAVSVRVDSLHQCAGSSPYQEDGFEASAGSSTWFHRWLASRSYRPGVGLP
jgi:hypothetical protein